VAGAAAALMMTSCGLPGGGSVRTIDDASVPYRLLESDPPSPGPLQPEGDPGPVPVVFWVTGDHRVVPEATGASCDAPVEVLVDRLLNTLASGPSEGARADGRSSAVPADVGLEAVGIVAGTVEVDIELDTSISAEQLPVAVGQLVLTVLSAPTVQSVVVVSGGEPIQVPLPGGALTDGPVTAEDYKDLLPDRLQASGGYGCPTL
jgi:hypothetical protein